MSEGTIRSEGDPPSYGPGFWVGLVVGIPVLGYGIRGIVVDLSGAQLASFLRYSVGAAVVHDLVVAPAVCIVGYVLARRLPPMLLGPVQAALVASGAITLVSFPLVRGYGATPGEPSFLSRDYTASLVVSWAVVWLLAGIAVVRRALSARRP